MDRPKQADVAKLAGVSRATVSYVLSGRAGGAIAVADDTRERILAAAQQLGYVPDAGAQSLKSGATRMIGATCPDLGNPHMWEILHGADVAVRAQGYDLNIISTHLQYENERGAIQQLLRRRLDGLIMTLTNAEQHHEDLKALARRHSPVVILGDYDHTVADLDTVTPGHREGAAQLMTHLLALGHRRISFLYGVASESFGRERLDTYFNTLRAAGVQPDDQLVEVCGVTVAQAYAAAQRILARTPRPTAIVAINDQLAIGVLRAVADAGLRVPEDISIAGFDDINLAQFMVPALTTVKVMANEIGQRAVALIFDRLKDPNCPTQQITMPAQLAIRASTGPVSRR
jgi:LacI family transcriptional regulator